MTADGVRMVRFAPSMAQRVTSLYPVGSSASVYVTSRMMGTMTSYDLAGVGPDMPTPSSMMMPMDINPVDVLKGTPYIQMGAKEKGYKGKLIGYISDPMSGEVLGIVLDEKTLVRVPMQNRLIQASTSPTGVAPIIRGCRSCGARLRRVPALWRGQPLRQPRLRHQHFGQRPTARPARLRQSYVEPQALVRF